MELIMSIGYGVVAILLVGIALGLFSKVFYKKAPPNVAMVITGPRGSRTVVGQGCLIIPILQRVDYMSLENIQSDFTSRDEIPTKDAINIMVDAVANVSIAKDPDGLKIAASKFLGYDTEKIREIITPVFEGNIREIISQTTLKDLIQGDKKEFAERVIENVTPNLRDMGLELTTFNIQNFKDRAGVIDNLGLENTVQISKDAAISKARAEQEIAIAQAEAKRVSNEAQVKTEAEIARRQNELAVQKAELKQQADTKKAAADAAYAIQQEEQRKTIEAQTADANLVKMEKEIELKEREVQITERALEAQVKKKAEAEKYAAQMSADANLYNVQKKADAELFKRQRDAEAQKFEAEQKAAADMAKAEAEKYAKVQEAEGVRAVGEAEAAAIKARGEAEAAEIRAKGDAEAEALMKKAEAMKLYGESAQMNMQLETVKVLYEQLPAIAQAIGNGYANADIKLIGNDSGQLAGDIMANITQVAEGFKGATGVDLTALLSGMIGAKIAND